MDTFKEACMSSLIIGLIVVYAVFFALIHYIVSGSDA